ncbi:serine hydrolase domain-containing protein [Lewinella sp. IMCC34183]|uniref:serine hydrolase domain-containing protein n=1 Tax=Lewinella sp. IMCC34183 TaxID=2248762 RepID=UPI0013008337|nr:serine hydrolase domain-containing protein [Lewinella sp. IMCC34183]
MAYRYPLLLSVLFGWLALPAQGDTLVDAQDPQQLTVADRAVLYELLRNFPAGGEAAVARIDGDTTIYYGVRRGEGRLISVDNADRAFGIGSVTKVFTATLLATLVDAGELSLDDAVNDAYPFPFADSTIITYRQLATHTSGLPRLPSNMAGLFLSPTDPYATYTAADLETYLREKLTLSTDGQSSYSNLGFGLLGYTLSHRIATAGYAATLRDRVLDPLGMTATSYGPDSNRAELVVGVGPEDQPAPYWHFTDAMGGAGALVSTPRDMARFLRAQLDTTRTALALTREAHFVVDDRQSVGLGWQILQQAPERVIYWHNGAVGGYRAFVALDVERQQGIVLLTNSLLMNDAVDRAGMRLLH